MMYRLSVRRLQSFVMDFCKRILIFHAWLRLGLGMWN
jgi:hypothetical protein